MAGSAMASLSAAGVTAAPSAPQGGEPEAHPSSTLRTLRALRAALVAGSLVVAALCLLLFSAAHVTVDEAVNRSAPAQLHVQEAYDALIDADSVAIKGFYTSATQAGGIGTKYQNDIATALQSLQLAAEENAAGTQGSQDLQLIEGLVVTYTGQIEQADAEDQQKNAELALVYENYASYLLQNPDSGILKDLATLQAREASALAAQQSSIWLAGATSLAWLLPLALLLALFAAAHILVYRRFHRVLSIRLALAVAALFVMGVTCGLSLVSDSQFTAAVGRPFADLVAADQSNANAADYTDLTNQRGFTSQQCRNSGQCPGLNMTSVLPFKINPAPPPAGSADQAQASYKSGFAAADAAYVVRTTLIALMAVAASALTAFGLRPRLDEYRNRTR
jgi:hypothetical protein